jgi:hypothetical protein
VLYAKKFYIKISHHVDFSLTKLQHQKYGDEQITEINPHQSYWNAILAIRAVY